MQKFQSNKPTIPQKSNGHLFYKHDELPNQQASVRELRRKDIQ